MSWYDARVTRAKFDMRDLAGNRWPPPAWHLEKIGTELDCAEPKDRMMSVVARMSAQAAPDFSGIDWDRELAAFDVQKPEDFPAYYRQPFHSVPGGYLSEAAAVGDRCAMEAIYQEAHPRRSLGVRDELAALVPADARIVIDFGAGTGDGAAAIARRLPGAQVMAFEASPFMIVAGRVQNAGVPNLTFAQGLIEDSGLDDASVDAVAITLVLHECPDAVKHELLAEVHRVLRPGGTLVLADTAHDDLHAYRGFYEPYKEEWARFDPDALLRACGFTAIESHRVPTPLWCRSARKVS
jgi:SAM-dependent methyltransferase